ncbi:YitT family protein [Variovorax sp. V15]|uniref:YitT family protein n=1 Tax=Variovorax sp. V15 TaxID=3065952 RepID=UPI0034E85E55
MDQDPCLRAERRYPVLDDAQGFATALLLVGLGLAILRSARLLTGGIPGLAFVLNYASGWSLGWTLLIVNLPFIVLGWHAFGAQFTWKTLLLVAGLSFSVEGIGRAIGVQPAHPMFAAIAGGLLIGVGLLVLFRHGGSLGGFGVLALYLQRRYGWGAGAVQMVCDGTIVASAFALVEPSRAGYSIVSAVMVNLVLMWNHRSGARS